MAEEKKKKGFIAEFKEFISKGSVLDLAVGMIIGAAFTKIVTSMVNDLLMPIIGLLNPNGGFTGMYVGIIENGVAKADTTLANGAVIAAGDPVYRTYLYYGNFIQAVIDFVLVAIVLFLIVKAINSFRNKAQEAKEKLVSKRDNLAEAEEENKEE